ncbi:MAG: asparagine synthase (glutamine-hydrolyzing) [Acidobacteria bacterium]|nr:asparagine synthase (glutamine-hydrolyzing) [Acidobacteriota bacterium]
MCGISGIYEYGVNAPNVHEALIISMRDQLRHRGPDDAGVYVTKDRRLGFGHRRLAIVDLSPAGHNPMPNEDETVWITFNGEIYNHEKLRKTLINQGHLYRSRTDTETIIHLYEERGLDFVADLEGDFAIALWDENQKRLVLVRDRIGVKPLYYTIQNGRLIFASEIKAILAHPAIGRELDEESLYHYLTFLTTPAPRTMFAGINKLPAGCLLVCNSRGDIKITRYWDAIVDEPAQQLSEAETAQEVLRLLTASIEKRMMSDVPFGVLLSGGIDSTANVALMAQLMTQPVRTFTVGFADAPEFNEIEEARFVAREYHTDHHEILITQNELIEFLPQMVFHQDEPIADPVCVPLHYVSKLTRESGTTVIQVGEGADELFCGYQDYARYLNLHDRLWQPLAKLPKPMRTAMSAAGRFAYVIGASLLPAPAKKLLPDMFRRFAAGEELFWSGAFIFDETNKQRLFTRTALQQLNGNDHQLSSHQIIASDVQRLLAQKPQADKLEQMIYQELKLRLAELLLMRVDKFTMANSLEARVPFLDHHLVEFAMTIPRHMKYRHGETKWILKQALRGVIPERVLQRRKQGFGVPINEWMMAKLGGYVESSLLNSSLRRRELFDYEFIKRLINKHRTGNVNYSFFLWSLLNLSLWHDQWIDNPGAAINESAWAASTAKPNLATR